MLQWNVQGLRSKRHEAHQARVEEALDLVLLQKTLTWEHFECMVAGYTVNALPCGDGRQRDCMAVVRSSIPHYRIRDAVGCGYCLEVLAVQLRSRGLALAAYNIYPGKQLEVGEVLLLTTHSSPCGR